MSLRIALFACLLSVSIPSFAQDALPAPSGQWQADEKQNAKLFKQAQSNYRTALKARRAAEGNSPLTVSADDASANTNNEYSNAIGDLGLMGNAPPTAAEGGASDVRTMVYNHDPRSAGFNGLLPGELAFAAPANGMLIVQRLHDAVAFANDSSNAVTMVPLNGNAADLGSDVKVKASDDAGTLVLDATTLSGLHVQYRYLSPANTPGVLEVQITINGSYAENLQLERIYHRADVMVGAPTKD